MSLRAIAKGCANWVQGKVKFSSNITSQNMQSFIAIEQADGRQVSYLNTPQEFSASGLGKEKSTEMFTGIFKSETQVSFWLKTFDEIWGDRSKVEDVTEEVVASISTAYKENSPEFIYFVILYNILLSFWATLTKTICQTRRQSLRKRNCGQCFTIFKETA